MKPRLVFLGLDGVGKTSLAKYVADKFSITYYKDHQFKEKFFTDIKYPFYANNVLLQFFEQSSDGVVMDRWFMDDFVYGKTLKREFNKFNIQHWDSRADIAGFKIVYLHKEVIVKQDELIDAAYSPELLKHYDEYLAETRCSVLKIDSSNENCELQFKQIKKWLQ